MSSRRVFLKAILAASGGLMSPGWLSGARALGSVPRADVSPLAAAEFAEAIPGPLGPVTGPDGRPLVYDLDFGKVIGVGDRGFIIGTGLGLRLLRIHEAQTMWIEGDELQFAKHQIRMGDKVQASGTTLADMSLAAKHFRVNSIDNMRGILASRGPTSFSIWAKNGRSMGAYETAETVFELSNRSKVYAGFGNYHDANAAMTESKLGAGVVLNGYADRQGSWHAVDVFLGNKLPPNDAPAWITNSLGSRAPSAR